MTVNQVIEGNKSYKARRNSYTFHLIEQFDLNDSIGLFDQFDPFVLYASLDLFDFSILQNKLSLLFAISQS